MLMGARLWALLERVTLVVLLMMEELWVPAVQRLRLLRRRLVGSLDLLLSDEQDLRPRTCGHFARVLGRSTAGPKGMDCERLAVKAVLDGLWREVLAMRQQ
jgi:hypothetical protein